MPIPQQHTGTLHTGAPYAQPLTLGLATPGAAGDSGEREMAEICPFCSGAVARTLGITAQVGGFPPQKERKESMCCWTPMALIDHYDVFMGLPKPLRQFAIDRVRQEYQETQRAIGEANVEQARQTQEWYEEVARRWPHLIKGD